MVDRDAFGTVSESVQKAICSVSGKEIELIGVGIAGKVSWINCKAYLSCEARGDCPLAVGSKAAATSGE